MMFMMPMPPTNSDTVATAANRNARVRDDASRVAAISLRFRIQKSSS